MGEPMLSLYKIPLTSLVTSRILGFLPMRGAPNLLSISEFSSLAMLHPGMTASPPELMELLKQLRIRLGAGPLHIQFKMKTSGFLPFTYGMACFLVMLDWS